MLELLLARSTLVEAGFHGFAYRFVAVLAAQTGSSVSFLLTHRTTPLQGHGC